MKIELTPERIKKLSAKQKFQLWFALVQTMPQHEIDSFNRELSEALIGPPEKVMWVGKQE